MAFKFRSVVGLAMAGLLLVASGCSGGSDADTETTAVDESSTTTAATESTTTTATESSTTTTATETTTSPDTTPPAATVTEPVVYPAAGEGAATPEEATNGLLQHLLPTAAVKATNFVATNATSGTQDIVLAGPEAAGLVRSTVTLKKFGDSWYVVKASNAEATIVSPASGATVSAGAVTISGVAQGFEASVSVTALTQQGGVVAQDFGMAGSMGEAGPYELSLDLAGVTSGQTVVLQVAGGAGLEGDPGPFALIPVVIG